MQRSRSRNRSRSILVLASMIGVGLSGAAEATPHVCKRARSELIELEFLIMDYELERGELPPEASWSAALYQAGLLRVPDVPTDPWGHPIIFEQFGDGTFELMTVGYDGVRGTQDDQVRATNYAHTGLCKVPRRHWFSCGF